MVTIFKIMSIFGDFHTFNRTGVKRSTCPQIITSSYNGIKHISSSPYHCATNGAVDLVHLNRLRLHGRDDRRTLHHLQNFLTTYTQIHTYETTQDTILSTQDTILSTQDTILSISS